jgi:hypothetical protein
MKSPVARQTASVPWSHPFGCVALMRDRLRLTKASSAPELRRTPYVSTFRFRKEGVGGES